MSSRSPRTSLLTREEAEVMATRSRRLRRVGRGRGVIVPLWNWRVTWATRSPLLVHSYANVGYGANRGSWGVTGWGQAGPWCWWAALFIGGKTKALGLQGVSQLWD